MQDKNMHMTSWHNITFGNVACMWAPTPLVSTSLRSSLPSTIYEYFFYNGGIIAFEKNILLRLYSGSVAGKTHQILLHIGNNTCDLELEKPRKRCHITAYIPVFLFLLNYCLWLTCIMYVSFYMNDMVFGHCS